jgi:ankyrin repeat protein
MVLAKAEDGVTAVHAASRKGYLEVVQYLVRGGFANVDAATKEGRPALDFARQHRNNTVIAFCPI